MRHTTTWILVATSSYAEVFERLGDKLRLIEKRDHPEGRKKVHELITDKPGRTFAIASTERHSLGEENEQVKRHYRNMFIHDLLRFCLTAKNGGSFDTLNIIAPPDFLGELRKVFHKEAPLHAAIDQEIAKDLPAYLSLQAKVDMILGLI